MKLQIFSIIMILALVGSFAAITSPVAAPKDPDKGNKAPSGAHYNLNLIGVPDKTNFDGYNVGGSRIFIKRTGTTSVYVWGGNEYEIRDHDGTDGSVGTGRGDANAGIEFPYSGGEWRVQIYVRLLGPRDSSIKWKSEYYDGSDWVQISDETYNREAPPKFALKTGQLLMDGYRDVLWTLDPQNNFRIIQLRIYIEETA